MASAQTAVANPFDALDAAAPPPQPKLNPFDAFDAKPAAPTPANPFDSFDPSPSNVIPLRPEGNLTLGTYQPPDNDPEGDFGEGNKGFTRALANNPMAIPRIAAGLAAMPFQMYNAAVESAGPATPEERQAWAKAHPIQEGIEAAGEAGMKLAPLVVPIGEVAGAAGRLLSSPAAKLAYGASALAATPEAAREAGTVAGDPNSTIGQKIIADAQLGATAGVAGLGLTGAARFFANRPEFVNRSGETVVMAPDAPITAKQATPAPAAPPVKALAPVSEVAKPEQVAALDKLGEQLKAKEEAAPAVAEKPIAPAIKQPDGTILAGKPGDEHADVIISHAQNGVLADGERGFITPTGNFQTREQAAAALGLTEPLHSETLNQIQQNEQIRSTQEQAVASAGSDRPGGVGSGDRQAQAGQQGIQRTGESGPNQGVPARITTGPVGPITGATPHEEIRPQIASPGGQTVPQPNPQAAQVANNPATIPKVHGPDVEQTGAAGVGNVQPAGGNRQPVPNQPAQTLPANDVVTPQPSVSKVVESPSEQRKGFDSKQAKTQKKFLLNAVDQAISEAPESIPENEHGAAAQVVSDLQRRYVEGKTAEELAARQTQELQPLFGKYGIPTESTAYKAPLSIVGTPVVDNETAHTYSEEQRIKLLENAIQNANYAEKPKVSIEIPGDGTFDVINTKQALLDFKVKAQTFPTTAPKVSKPSLPRTSGSSPAPIGSLEKENVAKAASLHLSTDETRKIIQHIWSDGNQTVATDGRRLIIIKKGIGGSEAKPLVETPEGDKPPKGEKDFPNWRQIVPESQKVHTVINEIDTAKLFTIAKQAQQMTSERMGHVALYRNPDGSLGIASHEPELGSYEHNLSPGRKIIASVNPQFLIDAANAARIVGDEKVSLDAVFEPELNKELGASSGMAPVIVRSKSATVIMMPIRTSADDVRGIAGAVHVKDLPPKSEGSALPTRFTLRNSGPQTYTLVERLPQTESEKAAGEQAVIVKNEQTGKTQTVLENQLNPVSTAPKPVSTKPPKVSLDDQLRAAGMEPSVFKNAGQKMEALKRHKARSAAGLQAAFVPGAKEFVEQDVIPGVKHAAKNVADSIDELNAAFRAPTKSNISALASGIVRQNTAELAQKDVRAIAAFEKAEKLFNSMGVQANLQFIDAMENGRPQPTPELETIARSLRAAFDDRVAQVRALGTGKLEKLIENYFPHLWEKPAPARNLYSIIFGKRPLEGSKAFLKKRTIPTTREGIDAGLTPVSTNPAELTRLKLHEIDKYIMAHKILNEYKENGIAKFVRATEFAPDDHTKIDDRIADVYEGTTAQGSLAKRGSYYAPDDAARILNNYLSPGLRRFAVYRGLIALSNVINQVQLGLSGYHLRFAATDAAVSKLALALERASHGQLLPSVIDASKSATAPLALPAVENFTRGSKVLAEYARPGTQGGDFAAIVDALVKGGGRVQMDKFYKNSSVESFWRAFRAGNYPGAILRSPFAALEYFSKPTMEVFVPRMKLGIFADLARAEMDKNPNMTLEQQREAFGKIWDSVDNRMGQMVYDNLFWNKTLKDAAMLGTRSLGWNLGTVRELGGGVKDTATIVSRLKKGDPAVTHRMAYLVALPVIAALIGAVYHYMHTGKGPQELEDYFMPKTGKKLADGSDERVMFPSYMKDIAPLVKAGHNFGTAGVISRGEQMAVNKLGPALNIVADMMRNRDFYGDQIVNKDDPLMKIVEDEMRFVASQFKPFTISQYSRRIEPSAETKYETFTGIMPASKDLTRSKAMQIISDYDSRYDSGRTQSEVQLANQRRDLIDKIRKGDPSGTNELSKFVAGRVLTERQAINVLKAASSTADPRIEAFNRLPFPVAQEAFKAATPEEKKMWQPLMSVKEAKYSTGESP